MLEYSRLTTKHFKPLTDPLPVLTDEEIGKLTMPLLYYGGTDDALVKTVESAERLRALVPSAEINILEGTGHTILGKTGEIVSFIERNG